MVTKHIEPDGGAADGDVEEPRRETPVRGRHDVIVAGGGGAGIVAAVAAARNGADTLLIEGGGFLGGTLTAAYQLNFGQPPFSSARTQLIRGIPGELVERLVRAGGFLRSDGSSPFDPEAFKREALRLLVEAGVELRLYTPIVDAVVGDGAIDGVITESKAGREAFLAERVVDCTGDGDVAHRAGAPFTKGRESDGGVQPLNMGFLVGGVDLDAVIGYVEAHPDQFGMGLNRTVLETDGTPVVRVTGFFDTTRKYEDDYDLQVSYTRFGNVPMGSGREVVYVNMARAYLHDPLDPGALTRAELSLREQVVDVLDFLTDHIPGFADAFLLSTGASLGVRESRQITGEYVLEANDVLAGRRFDDAVVRSAVAFAGGGSSPAHPVDVREGGPGSTYEVPQAEWVEYDLPYRMAVPLGVDDLLVAGKCKSATHNAMALTKSVPVCMAEGQAAGTAAVLSLESGVPPRDLDVRRLQERLVADGVHLPDIETGTAVVDG